MSKKKEYWKKRFTDLQDREQLQVDKYRTKLDKKYKKVIADIERDIQVFYMRYAQAEGIDYATARRDLSKVDMEKWEVSLSEYRKMALSGDFENELESMYAKSRISRLEALKTQIRAHVEVLHKGIKEDTGKLLSNTFSDTYYRSIYELQKGTGIGINFATYNQDAVNILISQPFKGGNYSTRIWNSETSDRGKLVRELQDTLTSAFIRGDSAAKTIGEMTKRLNTSAYNIARVVQTETAYISGQASALAYKSQGVERYEFLVSLDEITCPKCRPLEGKDFGLDEKIEFINYPPIHPWCRCTTIPYYEDYDYGDVDTRIARAPDGTTYKVPDMTYKEWHSKYVSTQEENLAATDKHFQKSVLNTPRSDILNISKQIADEIGYSVKDINLGQQRKHIVGTHEYEQYVVKYKNEKKYGPSRITIPLDQVRTLIDLYSGKGNPIIKKGKWINQELITSNNQVVGIVVNDRTGVEVDTTVFKIHYGKKGAHIVPDYPSKKKGGNKQ